MRPECFRAGCSVAAPACAIAPGRRRERRAGPRSRAPRRPTASAPRSWRLAPRQCLAEPQRSGHADGVVDRFDLLLERELAAAEAPREFFDAAPVAYRQRDLPLYGREH